MNSQNHFKCNLESFFMLVLERAKSLQTPNSNAVLMDIMISHEDGDRNHIFEIPNLSMELLLSKKRIGNTILNEELDKVVRQGFTSVMKELYVNDGAVSLLTKNSNKLNVTTTAKIVGMGISNLRIPGELLDQHLSQGCVPIDFLLS